MANIKKNAFLLIIILLFQVQILEVKAEEKKSSKFSLSINFFGGPGYLAIGDINQSIASFNNYLEKTYPGLVWGKFQKLPNFRWLQQLEIRTNVSRRLGVGLAFQAPVHLWKDNALVFKEILPAGTKSTSVFDKPEIKIFLPVQINVNYSLANIDKLGLYFQVGAGLYHSRLMRKTDLDIHDAAGSFSRISSSLNVKPVFPAGYHIGIGLDYEVSKRLAFLVEIQARLAKFRNLKGSSQATSWEYNASGELVTTDYTFKNGTLYYFDATGSSQLYYLDVFAAPPRGSDNDFREIRRACLDLSGYAIRIRMKIKLY